MGIDWTSFRMFSLPSPGNSRRILPQRATRLKNVHRSEQWTACQRSLRAGWLSFAWGRSGVARGLFCRCRRPHHLNGGCSLPPPHPAAQWTSAARGHASRGVLGNLLCSFLLLSAPFALWFSVPAVAIAHRLCGDRVLAGAGTVEALGPVCVLRGSLPSLRVIVSFCQWCFVKKLNDFQQVQLIGRWPVLFFQCCVNRLLTQDFIGRFEECGI